MIKIGFSNKFTRTIFYEVFTEPSRLAIIEKLNSPLFNQIKSGVGFTSYKIFIRTKTQQNTIYFVKQQETVIIVGYQLGKSDFLDGRKDSHFDTLFYILTQMDESERTNKF
ncbi:hypothetical protein [Testudinibacter sp. TR-2022]|uniref:hypothetical protein n=1 Tax=Testudinibacter sp. TR-2022 TaxID=2585029 RepID=UPI0011199248|nr:hypothetical protein [Testudinibacter sp. TR-2022]TNH22183.1 hypothetical protein FHQ29_08145 [Testudinibacter sp. TR-2022]TNH24824.1 hypothetical protein FHQ27_09955 [Testudinibacter sp. TR-2022]